MIPDIGETDTFNSGILLYAQEDNSTIEADDIEVQENEISESEYGIVAEQLEGTITGHPTVGEPGVRNTFSDNLYHAADLTGEVFDLVGTLEQNIYPEDRAVVTDDSTIEDTTDPGSIVQLSWTSRMLNVKCCKPERKL